MMTGVCCSPVIPAITVPRPLSAYFLSLLLFRVFAVVKGAGSHGHKGHLAATQCARNPHNTMGGNPTIPPFVPWCCKLQA